MRVDRLHAVDDRKLIGDFRVPRQMFADLHTRHVGINRPELAANVGRGLRLQIVHIQMTGAAAEKYKQDRFVTAR